MLARIAFIASIAAVGAAATSVHAAVLHVPGDSSTIQGAIDIASAGDEVVVACGTYLERLTLAADVIVRSAAGDPSCVTVDAARTGRAVFANAADGAALHGITFTGGLTPSHGAGLYAFETDLLVTNCVFVDHQAGNWGGGVAFQGDCSPSFEDCRFVSNEAGFGAGAYVERGTASFVRCVFEENDAIHHGGGVDAWSPFSTPRFEECVFVRNRSLASRGGGASCNAARAYFFRCTFFENSAAEGGSALHCLQGASPLLENCILAFGPSGESVTCTGNSTPRIVCCDIWGNTDGDWPPCIRDQGGTRENLWLDPGFCDPASGDLTLRGDSPCFATPCGTIGAFDVACAPVSVDALTWGQVKARHR